MTGVRVTAAGGFDAATWQSIGIDYSVDVSSDAPADRLAHLLAVVDQVAEIPQAIRAGATVRRITGASLRLVGGPQYRRAQPLTGQQRQFNVQAVLGDEMPQALLPRSRQRTGSTCPSTDSTSPAGLFVSPGPKGRAGTRCGRCGFAAGPPDETIVP